MADVALDAIHKAYGTTPVVKGLTLRVDRGELLALLGPSGCGKTTTLRIIAGLERANRGSVRIDGRDVGHLPPEQRGLGMVFQSYAVWPHKTVAENVAYPLHLQRVSPKERAERVAAALSWVQLEALGARMPHALSGGQLQRVALARALVASPKVLLLDEPLSNLDATLREELRAEIAALRARLGTTMVYVTHDQSEALALADRVAVMNAGVIEQLAPPRELYERPASPFVAAFVGGANVLDGTVEGSDFVTAGQRFALADSIARVDGARHLVVRPEAVALSSTGTPLAVAATLFLGQSTEVRLTLGAGMLRALVPADVRPQPGTSVGVRFLRGILFR